MDKYEREAKEIGRDSWYLSWALDNYTEERSKGKTVEYGRGYFETEARKYTILDAPGHKTYVPSMIGGASQADYAVLVISARKGEFETGFEKGGQTREHAMLVKTAGVKKLILVINKMDDPTVQWDKERYDEIIGKMLPFLKSCGFNPKGDIIPVPLSGYTGANVKDSLETGVADWWEGKSLLQTLDDLPLPDDRSKTNDKLLMPISDKFRDMGTVAMGKIEAGRVRKGQTVMVMPNKRLAEVATIWIEETELNSAKVGDNVRLRLKGVEEEDCVSGYVICDPAQPVHATTTFEAQLQIIEWKSIIAPGFQAVCHFHSGTEEVSLTDLLHMIDKKSGKKSKHPPKFVKQGDACIVRLECAQPICLETYTDQPQLGRFTLRDESKYSIIYMVMSFLIPPSSTCERLILEKQRLLPLARLPR